MGKTGLHGPKAELLSPEDMYKDEPYLLEALGEKQAKRTARNVLASLNVGQMLREHLRGERGSYRPSA